MHDDNCQLCKKICLTWNDVALLTDQRACTFLCKTMLQIPMEDEIALQEIVLADWKLIETKEDNMLAAEMDLSLCFVDQQGEMINILVTVPLQGTVMADTKLGEARLLYGRGELCDGHLLLETVLQIPRELELQSTQVIVGQFAMEELLELPNNWPGCSEVLTTAAVVDVQSFMIEQQVLEIKGNYHLAVVYADDSQLGERLFAYQQQRGFTWQMTVPAGLQELSGAQPYYQSLAVQLLDDHHIQLTGSGVLCTLPAEQMEQYEIADETMDNNEDAQPLEIAAQLADATYPKIVPHTPSVVNCRGSRRAKLNQYMRDLNGMVQSPTSIRNFDIRNMETGQEERASEDNTTE